VVTNELGEREKSINNGGSGNTGEDKDGGIKEKIRKSTGERIGKELLFKKKKNLLYIFF